jgi:hypothetical protein
MFKNTSLKCILLFAVVALSACKDDKGTEFVGHWYEQSDSKHPNDINISSDNGQFHIDENRFYPVGLAQYHVSKLEAVAESDSVLKGNFFTMRLENGKLLYKDEIYMKK